MEVIFWQYLEHAVNNNPVRTYLNVNNSLIYCVEQYLEQK